MDAFDPRALTDEEFLGGTPDWRTDLYATCGSVLSHKESIALAAKQPAFTPDHQGGDQDTIDRRPDPRHGPARKAQNEREDRIEERHGRPVRNPLSLEKLVYLDGQKAVLYRSRMNPALGRNFEAMDPLEWLARLADHISDPGKHRTHFYAHYANRARGEPGRQKHEEEQGPRSAAAPQAGRGSSPRFFRRIRSSADAAVAAQGRRLHHRHRRHPPDPGPSRAQPAGEATHGVREVVSAGGRRGARDRGQPSLTRDLNLDRHAGRGVVSPSKAGKDVAMRRWGPIGPAEVMPALSHGW
jgi:hypothetical protein